MWLKHELESMFFGNDLLSDLIYNISFEHIKILTEWN